jgi:chromosome segregation ATPase
MTPAEREAAFKALNAILEDLADLCLKLDEERAARSRIQAELDQACADRDMARAQKERAEGELTKLKEALMTAAICKQELAKLGVYPT